MLQPPRAYAYIDAVARYGSIRKAAKHLNVASTALNRKILELEQEIATPLFERLPRGVRLTSAGEVLLVAIRRSMAEMRSAASQIEQLRGLVRGIVRIGCAQSVASDLVPRAIAAFQDAHPGVQFRLWSGVTSGLVAALLRDDVDLVLAHDPPPSDALQIIAEAPQPLCAMMRPDHPLAGRASLRLAELQAFRIAVGDETFQTRRALDDAMHRSRLTFEIALEASSVEALKTYTMATGAIGFQYEIGTRREVERGDLAVVPLSDVPLAGNRLVLACRAGRLPPIAAVTFCENLAQMLKKTS
ncbi:LysR family transcriptional regulator [Salinarimonas ramus]|uniref:LysR family transcriptional regulator n=2 Tax=Salinarimonas ramus TaxID=690164 RepID=A0A917QF61_9HYPH|nr:LysR family transcriptional regulator [Salinarimonas ramus]